MKRFVAVLLLCSITMGLLTGCDRITGDRIYVYNWGEYIDPEVNKMFEEETGIRVIYEEYETNEVMYPRVNSGAVQYDVLVPSDYMIQRMREEGLLQEINFDNIPNIKYIGKNYLESSKSFDPENKYSIPYCWGTVGILYNSKLVDEEIDSWSALFDSKYKNEILMIDSVRDAFGIALKYLGYSINTTNKKEIEEAQKLLLEQKPLVQSYVVDQVRDMMIGGEAKLGVIYSGEAIYTQRENPDLVYVVPKEGSNVWIDSLVIPKNAPNKEFAEKYINFLLRPDIAKLNFDYITYSTPNTGARDMIEDEDIKNSEVAFPSENVLKRCETFQYLGKEMDDYYLSKWKEIKGN